MLRQRLRAARANEDGFTLVELLIVVVILGVLSGIVVFAVANFNDNGTAAACKTDIKNVETAAEAYYAQKNPHAYPADTAALVAAKYLREEPPTGEGITINATTGAVTATGPGCN